MQVRAKVLVKMDEVLQLFDFGRCAVHSCCKSAPWLYNLTGVLSGSNQRNISLLVAFFFPSQADSCLLIRVSLSCGSLASMRTVSISIPKKIRE